MASKAKLESPVGNHLPSHSTDELPSGTLQTGGTPVKIETPISGFSPKHGNVTANLDNRFPNLSLDPGMDGKSGLQTPLHDGIKLKK